MNKRQKTKIEYMLKSLGFLKNRTFEEAYDLFQMFQFGLKKVPITVMINQLDCVCQIEKVGKYRPQNNDWW